MPLEIVTLPCLDDNYVFLLHDAKSGDTAVVDVPDGPMIDAALAARGWTLTHVLFTHHHWDHIDGLPDMNAAKGAKIYGGAKDVSRLPPLDMALKDGDAIMFGSETITVLDVPGHSSGHIAFHAPGSQAVFTGDSLMALGCGRLFDGTAAQMWDTLTKLAALPDDTIVYSGHEYTLSNAAFAYSVEPQNAALLARISQTQQARAQNQPTVPSTLLSERATNPFLRAASGEIRAVLDMETATDAEVFTELRKRKDNFKGGDLPAITT